MQRAFNVAGPNKPELHYTLPPAARVPGLLGLIEGGNYFVVHAPRQTGKTTALLWLAEQLTASGRYAAVVVSCEAASPFAADPARMEATLLASWQIDAKVRLPPELRPPPLSAPPPGAGVRTLLAEWATACPRPLVIFVDEIDSLWGDALLSVLRQIRAGFPDRPSRFPRSVGLCGMRDLRDYKLAAGGGPTLGGASPFNIKVESVALRDFHRAEIAELYGQHTAATGQAFTPAASARAWELTRGQPWLVNALARQCVELLAPDNRDVGAEDMEAAKELLIRRQDTHLDSLAERLREDRVRRVIEPMLAGETLVDVPSDDLRFVLDLGLVRDDGGWRIANPIYQEIVPRVLADTAARSVPDFRPTWLRADGSLDEDALLAGFCAFWRQHGEPLLKAVPYAEVAPHLVLMAWLHRVVNGGGTIEREYAIGAGRMDLCVRYAGATLGVELKVWRAGEPDPREEGLAQLDGYLAGLGLDHGWLVIFDRREGQLRIAHRTGVERAVTPSGRRAEVVRA